jgi:hypothetical protein
MAGVPQACSTWQVCLRHAAQAAAGCAPLMPDTTSGADTLRKAQPHSLAMADASAVLPQPGGPCSSTPRGGSTPSQAYTCRGGRQDRSHTGQWPRLMQAQGGGVLAHQCSPPGHAVYTLCVLHMLCCTRSLQVIEVHAAMMLADCVHCELAAAAAAAPPTPTPTPPTPAAAAAAASHPHLWVLEGVLNELPYVIQHLLYASQVSVGHGTGGCGAGGRGGLCQ